MGGPLVCTRAGDGLVTVDMGAPRFDWREVPLAQATDTNCLRAGRRRQRSCREASAVSVGNPHVVLFVDDAENAPVAELGPRSKTIRCFPQRTNVEFVSAAIARTRLRMRVWERGVGITLACGTGACATAVAAHRRGLTGRKVEVVLDGGTLHIEWRESDDHVLMTGPATLAFSGEVDLEALRAMSAEIVTFGCRLNAYESEAIRARAGEAGLDNAMIFNTCAVTAEAVRQSRQAIRKARREQPEAQIIVTGCAAQTEPRTYAGMAEVDLVLGNAEKLEAQKLCAISAEHERVRVNDIMSVRETAARWSTVSRAARARSCRCRTAAIIAAPSASFPMAAEIRAAWRWARWSTKRGGWRKPAFPRSC